MGVNGLTGILKRFAPQSVRVVHPNVFSHQTVAVDASCHLNKFVYGEESHNYKHIYGFYLLARYFDLLKIHPIFVFDGSHRLEAKRLEHERRERQRRKVKHSLLFEKEQASRLEAWLEVTEETIADLPPKSAVTILSELDESLREMDHAVTHREEGHANLTKQLNRIAQDLREAVIQVEDKERYTRTVRSLAKREKHLVTDMLIHRLEDVRSSLMSLVVDNQINRTSLEKRSIRITQALRNECQDFLQSLGYVCFSCNHHEAEAMCAHLGKAKRTTATISEDLDTLAFGDTPLIRHFFSRVHPILFIDPVIARKQLGLSKRSFIDFCILCGTDFSGTIQGVGPIRALQYITKYKKIETILKNLNPKHTPQPEFDYKLARRVFKSLPSIAEEDAAYEKPRRDEHQIADMLKYYEIDPIEADIKVKTALLQQSILDGQEQWETNPFSLNDT